MNNGMRPSRRDDNEITLAKLQFGRFDFLPLSSFSTLTPIISSQAGQPLTNEQMSKPEVIVPVERRGLTCPMSNVGLN